MVTEILELGFRRIELGYDLRLELVAGVKKMIAQRAVSVGSVHNFCPVPVGAPRGHPELFTPADPSAKGASLAVHHITKTVEFAAEVGATAIVVHAGNVVMKRRSERLIQMIMQKGVYDQATDKARMKLQFKRDKKVPRQLDSLRRSIESLLPTLEKNRVVMAVENLPTWESIPTEAEWETILNEFKSPWLGYWHDIGHGQIRENMGFIRQDRWLERLENSLTGMHIHDVIPPAMDHEMPPNGSVDFKRFKKFAKTGVHKVFEPRPTTKAADIQRAAEVVQDAWTSV